LTLYRYTAKLITSKQIEDLKMNNSRLINGVEVLAVKGKNPRNWGFACKQLKGICWGASSMKKAFADAEKYLKSVKAI
jgi:hypothetical protein